MDDYIAAALPDAGGEVATASPPVPNLGSPRREDPEPVDLSAEVYRLTGVRVLDPDLVRRVRPYSQVRILLSEGELEKLRDLEDRGYARARIGGWAMRLALGYPGVVPLPGEEREPLPPPKRACYFLLRREFWHAARRLAPLWGLEPEDFLRWGLRRITPRDLGPPWKRRQREEEEVEQLYLSLTSRRFSRRDILVAWQTIGLLGGVDPKRQGREPWLPAVGQVLQHVQVGLLIPVTICACLAPPGDCSCGGLRVILAPQGSPASGPGNLSVRLPRGMDRGELQSWFYHLGGTVAVVDAVISGRLGFAPRHCLRCGDHLPMPLPCSRCGAGSLECRFFVGGCREQHPSLPDLISLDELEGRD